MKSRSGTYDFSSKTVVLALASLTLPLLFRSSLNLLNLRFRLLSSPVEKSANKTWTKNSPPARGQIESDVVAEVREAKIGERSESSRGGKRSWRRGVGGGIKATPSTSPHLSTQKQSKGGEAESRKGEERLTMYPFCTFQTSPSVRVYSISHQSQTNACPPNLTWSERTYQ